MASYTVTALTAAEAATSGIAPMCPAPDSGAVDAICREVCKTLATEYRIYFIFGPTLVRWKFLHTWCYDATVTKLDVSDDLSILSNNIRVSGSNSHTEGPLHQRVVRSLDQGLQFDYCLTFCLKAFNPKIDVYFTSDGRYIDQSII